MLIKKVIFNTVWEEYDNILAQLNYMIKSFNWDDTNEDMTLPVSCRNLNDRVVIWLS